MSVTTTADLEAALAAATQAIPPLWPLATSVAVNPFLGQTGDGLAQTAALLERVGGVPVTMPRAWFAEQIATGMIIDADLSAACAAADPSQGSIDVTALKAAAAESTPAPVPLPNVADLAAEVSGIDWPGIIDERLGAWAAGHFDAGQALWAATRGSRGAYAAWRATATHDLTPEILGLRGFAQRVTDSPQNAGSATAQCLKALGLEPAALGTYFHQLLLSLGGWAQYARYLQWQAELDGKTDTTLSELLAIRLVWEEALLAQYGAEIAEAWAQSRAAHATPAKPTPAQIIDAILQDAADHAAQRRLATQLITPAVPTDSGRPAVQAAFCIDVRSEVFRRAFEAANPGVQTLGFAGFFGLTLAHRRFASDVVERRLPVLVAPGISTKSTPPETMEADQTARFTARARRAWGRFKLAAVSSFAFVEAMGPVYVAKLTRDALGRATHPDPREPAPQLDPPLPLGTRVEMAETVLRAMSLTRGFARVVLITGHGATVTNNPHASALQCGACGGHAGDVNARLLASLLNDPSVRDALAPREIEIPDDTLFVGALHDTTTDAVTLYATDRPAPEHASDLADIRRWLAAAGAVTRAERAVSLPGATDGRDPEQRSRNWAELRPEWALAGCAAFVAAPRRRTAGRDLGGRVFLHDYDWQRDEGFGVLEVIMTAPVVVASWINLQYYGSTVAPEHFGSGNKLLHNVVGGIGVIEGNGGRLASGLPWQSVHDGTALRHTPVRLSVCVEAPRDALTDILGRHPQVRALFDNGWLHLFALDEAGQMRWRYQPGLTWEAAGAEPTMAAAS